MSFLRAFTLVGSFTFLSRIFGFSRDFLMATVIGPGLVSDVFIIAFRFPNLFRRLFAEGAFNAAFVPQFNKKLSHHGRGAAFSYAEDVLAVMTVWLVILTSLAIIFMPEIMRLLVPGFLQDMDKFHLAVDLSRITFPYLFCMVLCALLSGLLNSFGRFSAPSLTPILLNIILIAILIIMYFGNVNISIYQAHLLGYGVLVAGAGQLLLLLVFCYRADIRLKIKKPTLTQDVKYLLLLMIPGVIGASATQINLIIGDILASLLPGNAISWLFFADRLMQLPLGVIGIAIGVALLPSISRDVHSGNIQQAKDSLAEAIKISLFFTLPASVALFLMADKIILTLFGYGAFTTDDVHATAYALKMGVVGLPAFVLIKPLIAMFFANEDTRTPVIISSIMIVINASLAYLFMQIWQHGGIALAAAIAGWLNCSCLVIILKARHLLSSFTTIFIYISKLTIQLAFMIAVLYLSNIYLSSYYQQTTIAKIACLIIEIMAGGGAYLIAGFFLKTINPSLFRRKNDNG